MTQQISHIQDSKEGNMRALHWGRLRGLVGGLSAVAALIAGWLVLSSDAAEPPVVQPKTAVKAKIAADGQELFHRSWLPNDPRSPQGDGLGPLFNETSCVACHNQGGSGGGGASSQNVELLSALVVVQSLPVDQPTTGPSPAPSGDQLAQIHPDFRTASSVVLHRFGTSPKHTAWRQEMLRGKSERVFRSPIQNTTNTIPTVFQPTSQPGHPGVEVDRTEAPASEPATEPAAPPATDSFDDQPFGPGSTPPQPFAPTLPGSPAEPSGGFSSFDPLQQPAQQAIASGVSAAEFPIITEAMQEIQRLRSEARQDLQGTVQKAGAVLQRSQRNTPALFGAGLIDAVPDTVIEAAAATKHKDFPRVSGRVHRLADGTIGRFGWKAQKVSLEEFTLAACANELGLTVGCHHQAAAPYDAPEQEGEKTQAPGPDMTDAEAKALVAYLRNLPAPAQQKPRDEAAAKVIDEGERIFKSVGCAACHRPNLGEAKGVYSDLLLHDMGGELGAIGHYGMTPHNPEPLPQAGNESQPATQVATALPTASEWRTPPLWGVRDSAPYLHDGRAGTLEQAIAFHGGEASDTTIRFFMLPPSKRQQMVAFLKTLAAP